MPRLGLCPGRAAQVIVGPVVLLLFPLLFFPPLPPVSAQQSPPLQGQGVPPCFPLLNSLPGAAAPFTGPLQCPTRVFVSVELLKLLEIDDQNYQFSALMNVQQSWYDPRAEATMQLINAADLTQQWYRGHQRVSMQLSSVGTTLTSSIT